MFSNFHDIHSNGFLYENKWHHRVQENKVEFKNRISEFVINIIIFLKRRFQSNKINSQQTTKVQGLGNESAGYKICFF